jgi:hypothetical protein
MIRGSCLCGGVRFEVGEVQGPFELCHCSRCRKATGSAFAAGLYVSREHFTLLQGGELISAYEAPVREAPPAYRTCFCSRCGSSVPDALSERRLIELPAGSLDGDPVLRPDKHIYVEDKAPWFTISDRLPQLDKVALARYRANFGAEA